MQLRFRALCPLLFALATSCNDVTAPERLSPDGRSGSIDITVANLTIDVVYEGASVSYSQAGDHCFAILIDGVQKASACNFPYALNDLVPGAHTIAVQQQGPSVNGMPPMSWENALDPVSLTLPGGTTTAQQFDITAIRGKLVGMVNVNGTPASYGYQACIDQVFSGYSCVTLGAMVPADAGHFTALVRPGPGTGGISGQTGRLASFTFDAAAGQTVDVGTIEIQFANLKVNVVYGQMPVDYSLGGDHCFAILIDGVQKANACNFPYPLDDLAPGPHTVALQQQLPSVNGMPPMGWENALDPVTVDLPGGVTTAQQFDIAGIRGRVVGKVNVNGQPAGYGYQACIDQVFSGYSCVTLGAMNPADAGKFAALVRPGAGTGGVSGQTGRLASFAFDVAAGQTADVGMIEIQFANLKVDVLYQQQSVDYTLGGDHCFAILIDGVQKANACNFPYALNDLPPGAHTIALQQQGPSVNGMPPMSWENVGEPVNLDLAGGTTTVQQFDITAIRGKVVGMVNVNGTPASYGYQACIDQVFSGYSCVTLGSMVPADMGKFAALVKPGPGSGGINGQSGRLASFTFIAAAGLTTQAGDLSTQPGATPVGPEIAVQPINYSQGSANTTVNLTFASVTTSGTTTVVQSSSGPAVPAGLTLGTPPVYFDLSTTATFDGTVKVCINYTGTTFSDPANLKLLHGGAGGSWTDVTTSHDQANRIICGLVTSFSPFVVAQGKATPADATAPEIVPTVTGTIGSNGWYTSDVALSWAVADAQSAVASRTGCDAITVTADVASVSYRCSATSAGGSAAKTVTIKRDASAPRVEGIPTGTLGSSGWYTSDVGVRWSASDDVSGVDAEPCVANSLTTDDAGVTYRCTATNAAGLSTTAQVTVKRDVTKPVITWTGADPYTIDQTVSVVCSATDATSGVATSTCANLSGPAYTFPLGSTTLSATASDHAGNQASASTSYSVSVTTASLCVLTLRWLRPDMGTELCAKLQNRDLTGYLRAVLGAGPLLPPERAAILSKLARALAAER